MVAPQSSPTQNAYLAILIASTMFSLFPFNNNGASCFRRFTCLLAYSPLSMLWEGRYLGTCAHLFGIHREMYGFHVSGYSDFLDVLHNF